MPGTYRSGQIPVPAFHAEAHAAADALLDGLMCNGCTNVISRSDDQIHAGDVHSRARCVTLQGETRTTTCEPVALATMAKQEERSKSTARTHAMATYCLTDQRRAIAAYLVQD